MLEKSAGFTLDRRLDQDSEPAMWLGLCELRVMNDVRWPWLILVPQRPDAVEIHDLTPLDQAMLSFETNMVAKALMQATGCDKINTGALGNIVRQMHIHIIARSEGDDGWPGPVWGYGQRQPYQRDALHQFIARIKDHLQDR